MPKAPGSIAPIISMPRPPLSSEAFPQQRLADLPAIRPIDVHKRPVVCCVDRAAPFHPARSSFSRPLAINASFRSLMHLACDPISGVSIPETNGTPSPAIAYSARSAGTSPCRRRRLPTRRKQAFRRSFILFLKVQDLCAHLQWTVLLLVASKLHDSYHDRS